MSNTKSYKLRRIQAAQKSQKQREAYLATFIDNILDVYNQNPNDALAMCHKEFGKERFSKALIREIHSHTAKVAYVYAINRCATDGQPFPAERVTVQLGGAA